MLIPEEAIGMAGADRKSSRPKEEEDMKLTSKINRSAA